ncbi:hypothetical protein [Sphingomonas profundi]|uniref:hypothetical protein n=1 Tax=Alterirhizorhabdus profundi TaxID=2681549 RepID=UPI0012E72E05|nr:hypothetical protein [Sphingomonas profundi]
MARGHFGIGARAGALAIAAMLAGCATRPVVAPLAVATVPPPRAARPQPPAGASAEQAIPPLDQDGTYRTINRAISSAATIWHVRSALNVAALGCRGAGEAALIADYNQLLASKRAVLKAAFAATEAESRKAGGDWRDAHDREMTQTYNFFAQPPAKERFCAVAAVVAAEAAAVPPDGFAAFSGPALARLEEPFTDFYRAYESYRRDLAAWEAGDRAIAAQPAPAATTLAYAPVETIIAWAPAADTGDRRLASAAPVRR